MKRLTIVSILILLLLFSIFAATTSDAYPYYILGHIQEDTSFSVQFSNTALPFNLLSEDVKYNEATRDDLGKPSEVRGLYVGNFSLASNSRTFRLYVTHTPLQHDSSGSKIDYRFYLQLGPKYGNTVKSCISSDNYVGFPSSYPELDVVDVITIRGYETCFNDVWGEGKANTISIINTGVYVSLEDKWNQEIASAATTETAVQQIPSGNYSSYVYFHLFKE